VSSGKTEKIYGINGPVIYLKGKTDFKMSEMVHVGEEKLVGEVISLDKDRTTVQVYEETASGRTCGRYGSGSVGYAGTRHPE
jgi:V/A-type H+-transporting ATPase subunit A